MVSIFFSIFMAKVPENQPQFLVIHHTAVSYEKNPAQLKATDNHHKGQGFPKSRLGYYVGYHALVEKDGTIWYTRGDAEKGAHTSQESINFRSLALCFTGNFDIEEPTIAQCKIALAWIRGKQQVFNIPDSKVLPHRHWAPKSCWGNKMPDDIIGYLTRRVEEDTQKPSDYALPAFEAAARYGFSSVDPKKPMDAVRLRQALRKIPSCTLVALEDCLEDNDKPLIYQDFIHAFYKAGAFL